MRTNRAGALSGSTINMSFKMIKTLTLSTLGTITTLVAASVDSPITVICGGLTAIYTLLCILHRMVMIRNEVKKGGKHEKNL